MNNNSFKYKKCFITTKTSFTETLFSIFGKKTEIWQPFRFFVIWLYLDSRIIFFSIRSYSQTKFIFNQKVLNSIRKAFVYISFGKLYKLGQPYKLGQEVSNYFVSEYTPPSVTLFYYENWILRKSLYSVPFIIS